MTQIVLSLDQFCVNLHDKCFSIEIVVDMKRFSMILAAAAVTFGMANAQTNANNKLFQKLADDMVLVEGGTYEMGATPEQGTEANEDEQPVQTMTVATFYICKYEVTQELWQAVMGTNPSYFKGAQLPVEHVSLDDCKAFIEKLNELTGKKYRLMTQAEWEYAARGGNKSKGYKYSGSNNPIDVAWFNADLGVSTSAVGKKAPNELGIYDMSGNVCEWCSDKYEDLDNLLPEGDQSIYYNLRGGSWFDPSINCRVSYRNADTSEACGYDVGLRLALSE